MIELFVSGVAPQKIARMMERPADFIKGRLERYKHDTNGVVSNYEPYRRVSRVGKPLSENELFLIGKWKEAKVSPKAQARFLSRQIRELGLDKEDLTALVDMKTVGTGVDLVLAYRYLYYCKNISILSDQAYDALEKEEMDFGSHGSLLSTPGSDNPDDYPPHIRALALYLVFKWTEREKGK